MKSRFLTMFGVCGCMVLSACLNNNSSKSTPADSGDTFMHSVQKVIATSNDADEASDEESVQLGTSEDSEPVQL